MVPASSMWMHFNGQMSKQPSHMMHSDWSMWMNCLGLTALVRSSGAISVSTYSPGKSGIDGLASVLAMTDQFYGNHRANLTDRTKRPPFSSRSHTTEVPERDEKGRGGARHLWGSRVASRAGSSGNRPLAGSRRSSS